MAIGPQMGNNRTKVGFFAKTAFGCCCFFTLISVILLFAFKSKAKRAMSGQLVSLDSASPVSIADDHQVMNVLLDYFGSSSILFALLFVYICYKIFIAQTFFKKFDGFVLGTSILGFNILLIGFSSMLSALSPSFGGLLGDFFFLYFFNKFGFPISGILLMLVTFGGLFLFTFKSPVWYIDNIGNLLTAVYNRLTGKSTDSSLFDDGNQVHDQDSGLKVNDVLVTGNLPEQVPEMTKGIQVVNAENEMIHSSNEPLKKEYLDKFQEREKEQSSSFLTSLFARKKTQPEPNQKEKAETLSEIAAMQPQLKNVSKGRNSLTNRVEPKFSAFGVPTDPSFLRQEDSFVKNTNKAPATFGSNRIVNDTKEKITTAVFASDNRAVAQSTQIHDDSKSHNESEVQSLQGPKTVINGVAVGAAIEEKKDNNLQNKNDNGGKTIITRLAVASDNMFDSVGKVQENNSNDHVVYKAGADNITQQETIGSPMRRSEVSTVIIRTTSTPKMNVTSGPDGLYGKYTQNSEQSPSISSQEQQKYETSVNHTVVSDSDQNIISFDDLTNEDPVSSQIKVNSLPPEFKKTDDGRLSKNTESLIKESDDSYDKYRYASRGVNSNQTSNVKSDSDVQSYKSASSESAQIQTSSYGNSTQNNQSSFVNNSAQSNSYSSVNAYSSQSESYGSSASNPPFENMSSISGNVPRSFNTSQRAPIGKIPTVTYSQSTETIPTRYYDSWRPPFSLLARSNNENYSIDDEIEAKISKIDQFMKDFNVKANVANFESGPVVTRFDLNLERGVSLKAISRLTEDLQRTLMTDKINILKSVAGTSFVGVEVPNDRRKMITLGDVVQSEEFATSKAYLPMCMGVDTIGRPIVADLATAPHLLIAGTTGSGKSAGLNSMLVSLLLSRSPADLRLIMIDPKTVEFTQYHSLPHLICPIITDPLQAVASVSWLIKEQERRYKLLSLLHVSKISQCNDLIRSENAQGRKVYDPVWTADMGGEPPELKPLPYIVLVIDEFADLMAVSGSSGKKGDLALDQMIGRLAGKARAAGIHIILATQTPRSEIVTGTIRANLPSRIAYTVQNGMESRIILDETGAENLLGNGDMMVKYQQLKNNQLFRAHGPYASTDDVHAVVDSWIQRAGEPEYIEDVTNLEEEDSDSFDDSSRDQDNQLDGKFDLAVEHARIYCANSNKGISVTELQSELKIGFVRARNIHRQLQQQGIIDSKGFLL